MFNKIFARGTGKSSGINYLLSPYDAQKKLRAIPPVIKRGDPSLTKAIINTINYKQKYTSGVLSFEESPDQISDEVLNEVMDHFEKMVSCGMEQDRLNWLWVLHRDKKRVELHYVSPTIDLASGKRFSHFFDRVDRPRFRAWERYVNAAHGFSDPSNPAKKRDLHFPTTLPRDKAQAILEIHNVVNALLIQRTINCRDDIIKHLQLSGYKINRISQVYISIQDSSGRKLRMRGQMYEADFTSIKSLQDGKKTLFNNAAEQSARLSLLKDALDKEIGIRSSYISKRFRSLNELIIEPESFNSIYEGINHDRNTKSSAQFFKKNGTEIKHVGGKFDESIQRISSELTDSKHRSKELRKRLTNIKCGFTKFIENFSKYYQRLKTNINKPKSVNKLKFKY